MKKLIFTCAVVALVVVGSVATGFAATSGQQSNKQTAFSHLYVKVLENQSLPQQ